MLSGAAKQNCKVSADERKTTNEGYGYQQPKQFTERNARLNRIRALKAASAALLRALEVLQSFEFDNSGRVLDISVGIDFYHEVQRFEISLIRQALKISNGHQGRAASLLRL